MQQASRKGSGSLHLLYQVLFFYRWDAQTDIRSGLTGEIFD